MNRLTFSQRVVGARFLAVFTTVSLLLTAFPLGHMSVEAARTGVTVSASSAVTVLPNETVMLQAQVQDDTTDNESAQVILTDGGSGGVFTNANSNNCTSSLGSGPQSLTVASNASNKNFCYQNATPGIYTVSVELQVNSIKIGEVATLGITVEEPQAVVEMDKKVDICHWNGSVFNLLNVSVNTLGNSHGASGVNDGDIIPVVNDYTGQNLTVMYGDQTGTEVLENLCVVEVTASVETCDDGIQNQDETDIDIGGICGDVPPQETCSGVDCQVLYVEEPVDVCENLEGVQEVVPEGYEFVDEGVCELAQEPPVENTCMIPDNLADNELFTLGEPAPNESSLETIITDNGFGSVNVLDDQINTQVWDIASASTDSVTLTLTLLGGESGNAQAFGYYEAGDASSFVPVFKVGPHAAAVPALVPGDSIEVTIPNNTAESLGFAVDSVGSPSGAWFSEFALNVDDEDNFAVYNPSENTYLLAFEDRPDDYPGDNDHNDLIIQVDGIQCNEDTYAIVHASKILCDDESELPNWNTSDNSAPTITENTAIDWVAQHDSCELVSDWEFEWAPENTPYPGDTLVGVVGEPWTTFVGSTTVPASAFDQYQYFSVREVLQDNFLPFTYNSENEQNTDDYTAELACHIDGLNYDNYDRVDHPERGNEYYCVAWNVPVAQVEPGEYRIDGHKYESVGEGVAPLAGLVINLEDGEGVVIMSTTTDDNGYYYFDVPEGAYEVHEVVTEGWLQVEVRQDGVLVETDSDVENCSFVVPEESDYDCDFYNESTGDTDPEPILGCTDESATNYNPDATLGNIDADNCEYEEEQVSSSSDGGSSSTRVDRDEETLPLPQPLVLGASTINNCPFIVDYMQIGVSNNPWEVTKLQLFLNMFKDTFGGTENPVNGFFGPITDANVKAFQAQYSSEILVPWFEKGIVPHSNPTGFVYKTTLWKINSIVCPDYAILPDYRGEDLTTNVNID